MFAALQGLLPSKAVEDAKLDEDFRSSGLVSQCHGGRHRLVPFVLEEGGTRLFGEHALAILSEIADIGAHAGKLISIKARPAARSPGPAAPTIPRQPGTLAASAYWVRRWKQEVSGWLQVTMSDTLLRQTSRASAVYDGS